MIESILVTLAVGAALALAAWHLVVKPMMPHRPRRSGASS